MPKKKNPNSRPVPRPAAPKPPLPDGPIRIGATPIEEEQEPLFVLEDRPVVDDDGYQVLDEDGNPKLEDVEYTIPKQVNPNRAIRYLRDLRRGGDAYAVAEALTQLLGEDTMDALAEAEGMTDEHMDQIMRVIEHKMTAATGRVLGNS